MPDNRFPVMVAFSVSVMTSCLLLFLPITLNVHFAWCAEADDPVSVRGSVRPLQFSVCLLLLFWITGGALSCSSATLTVSVSSLLNLASLERISCDRGSLGTEMTTTQIRFVRVHISYSSYWSIQLPQMLTARLQRFV